MDRGWSKCPALVSSQHIPCCPKPFEAGESPAEPQWKYGSAGASPSQISQQDSSVFGSLLTGDLRSWLAWVQNVTYG